MINNSGKLTIKVFACLLACILLLLIAVLIVAPAKSYADTIDNYSQIEEYAKSFVSRENGIEINSIVPIYDLNNNIIRYCVNYIDQNGNDFGYVILNKCLSDGRGAVIELSLGSQSDMSSKSKKYYWLDGLEYGVKTNGANIMINDKTIALSQAKRTYKNCLECDAEDNNGYVDTLYVDEITRDLVLADYWYTFEPITQMQLVNAGLRFGDYKGICGLTTAMNVLKYYYDSGLSKYSNLMLLGAFGNIDLASTAQRLYTGFVPSGSMYNLPKNTIRKNALKHYINTYTSLSISISRYLGIQFWNYFYNDIANGYIIDVRYDINSEMAHAVLCVGAVEVSGEHYAGTRYLLVADTSNSNLRLLNFGYYSQLQGMKIKVY